MAKKQGNNSKKKPPETNGWDVLNNLIDKLFSCLKLSVAAVLWLLWLIVREIYIILKCMPADYDYGQILMSTQEVLNLLFAKDNPVTIMILITIILVMAAVMIGLILNIRSQKKEINRLSGIRSQLMHGFQDGTMKPLLAHTTSEK